MIGRLRESLFLQVIVALFLGTIFGLVSPDWSQRMQPLGTAFIKLIQVFIAPIVFCIVVKGIVGIDNIGKVGKVGLKTLLYFEGVTTIALAFGVLVGLHSGIGAGMNIDPSTLDVNSIGSYAERAQQLGQKGAVNFFMNVIPSTAVSAFSSGDILQVLLFSIIFGCALNLVKASAGKVVGMIDQLNNVLFKIMAIIVKFAPVGVFGAVAFTVGKYGWNSIQQLGSMVVLYFAICILFIVVVFGGILKICGVNLFAFLRYFREELSIVLGTTASDCVLPQVMSKLEKLGIKNSVVGMTIPMGYSFNLDGFSIYLTLATVFIANATNTPLSLENLLTIILVSMITSKGAHGIPGSAIVILMATLSSIPAIPVAGLVLILPMDWFIGIARAITNLIGNCVATVVIAKWEKEIDLVQTNKVLSTFHHTVVPTKSTLDA